MADALDSKSSTQKVCGFESHLGHLTVRTETASGRPSSSGVCFFKPSPAHSRRPHRPRTTTAPVPAPRGDLMRRFVPFLVVGLAALPSPARGGDFALKDGDTVVFLGD